MDAYRHGKYDHFSDEAIAKRAAKRARRQELYAKISQSLTTNFTTRCADMWDSEEKSGTRKIEGHPGREASLFVSETLGQFDVRGDVKCLFAGMNREAGRGGHGITDGTINIQVDIKPIRGMSQRLDVPVYVKNGYMLQPGIFYHQGVPVIMSQSAIDDLVSAATFTDIQTDRKHMFSSPRTAAKVAKNIMPVGPKSKKDYDEAQADWEQRHNPENQPKKPKKIKPVGPRGYDMPEYQPTNPDKGIDIDSDKGSEAHDHDFMWGAEDMVEDESGDLHKAPHKLVRHEEWDENGPIDFEEWDENGPMDEMHGLARKFLHMYKGFDWAEDEMPLLHDFAEEHGVEIADLIDAVNDLAHEKHEDGHGDEDAEKEEDLGDSYEEMDSLHSMKEASVGSMRRLAMDIEVAGTNILLNKGSRIFVVAHTKDGIHVKHANGTEVILTPDCLA